MFKVKNMKNILFLLFFLFELNSFGQKPERQLIKWSNSDLLKWPDFKARPNRAIKAFAQTESQIQFAFQQNSETKFEVTLQSYFNPKGSWVKEESDYLLNHEQKHADITEVYTRMMRKEIAQSIYKSANSFRKEVVKIYEKKMKEMNSFQRAYDKETNHSIDKEKQNLWDQRINLKLIELKEYSNATLNILIK